MRTVARVVAFALAAAVAVLATLFAFGLTNEYGPTPNGGGLGEAVGWTAQVALPAVLVVLVLVMLGSIGMALSRRRQVVAGAALATLLLVSLGVVAGNLALTQRCETCGAAHSAACPGHTGPPSLS